MNRFTTLILTIAAPLVLPACAASQASYRDLDFGHPAKLQDASVPARAEAALYLPALAIERSANGSTRWRAEPAFVLGIGGGASAEIFSAAIIREARVRPRVAIAGVGLGVTRAFTLGRRLSTALSVNSVFPVGAASSARTTYATRGAATASLGRFRLHANASVGTYAIALTRDPACGTLIAQLLAIQCDGSTPALPPCSLSSDNTTLLGTPALRCGAGDAASSYVPKVASGKRLQAGAGLDRTFPAQATLLLVNVFAERFQGLLTTDISAEIAARHQLRPTVVVESSVARRFVGGTTSWQLAAGLAKSYGHRLGQRVGADHDNR